ncbi:MAG: hypothetical protein JO340_20145 [Acidobacteriaceae bacterium]|nr:hypothetical protein [Acidobacteriaceae bacterium]
MRLLKAASYQVEYVSKIAPGVMRRLRENAPDAFVVDLSRLPSHGREIAVALRQSRGTRNIPIVFCEGAEEKVAKIRAKLPDATYCGLRGLRAALRRALKQKVQEAVVPAAMMDRYAGRTVAQKLGIREGASVALVNAPRGVWREMREAPANVKWSEGAGAGADVTLCFVHEGGGLAERLSEMREVAGGTKLWILWRKGGSAARSEVTEGLIREQAIQLGMVDYKVCSFDAVWSAMAFALRRERRRKVGRDTG